MSNFNDDFSKVVSSTADYSTEYDPRDIEKNKWVCSLAYLWILFFLPLVIAPDSKFGRFHANQGLVFLLTSVIGGAAIRIAGLILRIIPLGGMLISIVSIVWGLLMFLYMILGIVNVLNGKAKELPIIGGIRLIK